jgi:UDP-4-amino-4,6-dideoxy-N-acetyl-beta-L-altrosamine N-acetyltransferase
MKNLRQNFEIENVNLLNYIFLNPQESELVRRWRNHESIRHWMYNESIISYDEHHNFIAKLNNDNHNFYWLVKSNHDYIGVIYLNRVDFNNRNAYLGIYANPENYAKGTGTLLVNLLINLVFKVAGLHTLKLEVLEENEKAINLYKKLGFTEEGCLKEYIFKSNNWKNVIIMGLINNE